MDLNLQFQTATTFVNLILLTQINDISFKQPYKTLAKENLMRIILFKSLKVENLLSVHYIF